MNPPTTTCPHCGKQHATTCPRVSAIEYAADGSVKRVELFPPEPVLLPFAAGARPPLAVYRSDPD